MMSNEMIKNDNPFMTAASMSNINQGAVTIESSRAMTEAQGKLLLAKSCPRNEAAAYEKVMIACSRKEFAEKATYSYPRSGSTISGPSIRLAEEIARCYGNLDYGIKELSQKEGESEMMAYCWDLETNTISQQTFVVQHKRDLKGGKTEMLTTQRDIYENNANMGGRRLRARILAILPPDLVDRAVAQCKATLAGGSEKPLADRIKDLAITFGKLGVKTEVIEKRLGHKLDTMTAEEFVEFIGIYNSIKDGNSHISDWFDQKVNADRTAALTDKIMGENKNVQ